VGLFFNFPLLDSGHKSHDKSQKIHIEKAIQFGRVKDGWLPTAKNRLVLFHSRLPTKVEDLTLSRGQFNALHGDITLPLYKESKPFGEEMWRRSYKVDPHFLRRKLGLRSRIDSVVVVETTVA
jgi:hypothetical protein